jgi:hypothetical protein
LDEAAILHSPPNARPKPFPRGSCPCCGMNTEEALSAARRHHEECIRANGGSS